MAEPSREELDRIHAARSEMLRPRWIARLVTAGLPLGETFWGGHVGMQLLFMPLWLLLVVVGPAIWPGASWGFWGVFFGLQLIWVLAVSQAVIRVALGTQGRAAGAWRWASVALTLLICVQAFMLLMAFITDPAGLGLVPGQ